MSFPEETFFFKKSPCINFQTKGIRLCLNQVSIIMSSEHNQSRVAPMGMLPRLGHEAAKAKAASYRHITKA